MRVVLDTNVIVSAIIFGGKPQKILLSVINKNIEAVTSLALFTELIEVLAKKFLFSQENLALIEKQIKTNFLLVQPGKTITIMRDEGDNRVLEAAETGQVNYIITGDKELLELKKFKSINIASPNEFLLLVNLPPSFERSKNKE